MTADLAPSVSALLAEIESGQLSERAQSTLARALRAAADGRPITQILAAGERSQRDDALQAMRARHFADLPPSTAAKEMAKLLARYAVSAWPIDTRAKGEPRAGTLQRDCFDVLSAGGGAPSWRTILRVLSRSPWAATKNSVPQGSMDRGA